MDTLQLRRSTKACKKSSEISQLYTISETKRVSLQSYADYSFGFFFIHTIQCLLVKNVPNSSHAVNSN